MRTLFASLRNTLDARKKYLHEAKREITYNNLRTLRNAVLLTLLFLTLFLLVTPLMIPQCPRPRISPFGRPPQPFWWW